ncbi:tetratricopeptide repeat protein [Nostoc sp.]|uniref:tetratricopeptide repeat protein n=1 Tax=Nostoc sp. TaxID=1180 RepID=UPI002FFC74F0
MNRNLSDWDDDLPPEPQEAYQDLLRALKRKSGFGLFFVQCTPEEADKFIIKLPQEIPQKKIAVLRFVESIEKLYQPVAEFIKDKQVDILLIKGLEYSLYKYEKRSFSEITERQFRKLTSVPHILNHLNQQRESFRDDFPITFVFLVRSFSINYFIHRAPDFFDWRSGMFELPITPEVVNKESFRLLDETDYEEYFKISLEKKIVKMLDIQDLLAEKHQTKSLKVSLLRELGRLLGSADEFEAAIASYDKALKIKPDYYEAWYDRGNALRKLGRYKEALVSYDKALKIKPDYHEALNNRGYPLDKLGHYEEAIASYDKALTFKRDYYEAWYNRGYPLDNLGRYEEAIASYDKALTFKRDYHEAWNNRGYMLVNLRRYEEAIVSYDKALEFKPDYLDVLNNRGYALDKLRRYEEALASYNKALEFQPDYYNAWYNRGYPLHKLERYEEALASYNKALEFQPDYYKIWYYRGISLGKLGRYEQAIASYDKALEFQPDYYNAWYNRGILLGKLGRYEQAINSFEQAVKNDPNFSKNRIIILFICKILLIIVKFLHKLINSFKILLKLIIWRR